MKKLVSILLILCFWACSNDDGQKETFTATVAIPETITKEEWRNTNHIDVPKPIEDVGKIYAYEDYIFIGEKFKGVHVIDNSNPLDPVAVAFLNIPGNEDIAIKNNFLYADNATDLVVFDISNISNITAVERVNDVFDYYSSLVFTTQVYDVDYSNYDAENEIIIGWTYEEREFEYDPNIMYTNDVAEAGNNIGTGGSLARFQIIDDYLYTVGEWELNTFNISNLSDPVFVGSYVAGWNIETMFHADGYLYLGGDNGMFIHSIENPSSPYFISEFNHWEGCDPVVVDGDYAYLTLRGGNDCGQELSVLEVIDVSNKYNPTLVSQHFLDNPYGLGYKDNRLFVCDGNSGLKVYDKTQPLQLILLNSFENVQAKDVIPLDDKLIMISENALYQYSYTDENDIELLSTLILN